MGMIQTPYGWYNPDKGTLTTYDAATGQLTSKSLKSNIYGRGDNPNVISALQSGNMDINTAFNVGGMGGRSNVNVMSAVKRAADTLMKKYPQMTWESASKYANQWVNDRVSRGHDANEIEDMAKGVFRDDKTLGTEFEKGMNEMVYQDDLASRDANSTNASMNPTDPRGSIQDELRAFAGRMMTVLPPDSPQVKRIAEIAAQAGNKYATQSGIGPGGITATGVANTAARANVDLQTQREGIGASALAAAGNQQLSVDQLNTQLQQQNQQANTMQGSNIGGMIGTGAGLIGGIVASAYGAPQALPGLMQGGGAAGQAIGGIAANNGPPIQYGGGSSNSPASTYKGRSWGTS